MTSSSLNDLIELFSKLPSLGPRSARRAVLYLLKRKALIPKLVDSLKEVQTNTKFCSICANLDIVDPCAICSNEKRKKDKIHSKLPGFLHSILEAFAGVEGSKVFTSFENKTLTYISACFEKE